MPGRPRSTQGNFRANAGYKATPLNAPGACVCGGTSAPVRAPGTDRGGSPGLPRCGSLPPALKKRLGTSSPATAPGAVPNRAEPNRGKGRPGWGSGEGAPPCGYISPRLPSAGVAAEPPNSPQAAAATGGR